MPDVFVSESPPCGLGLFIREPVCAGQRICDFKLLREVPSLAELRADLGEEPDHCTIIEGRFFLVGAPERYLNHSCDPNVYTRFDDEGISVVALQDLDAGCELTVDYLINNAGGNSWTCRCGSQRCRGETGISFFTLPQSVQEEYYPLLAPWFLNAHAEKLRYLSDAATE